ncbi:MAG: XdhC family protein [Sciscionella sp.]
MKVTDMLARVDGLRAQRIPFVLATVVRAERPTSAKPGDRALVLPDGTMEGFVGGTCAESTVRLQGLRLLQTGESTLLRITPDVGDDTVAASVESLPAGSPHASTVEGMMTVENHCLSGGTLDIFLETMLPPVLIGVHGDAPVARALTMIGTALGYEMITGGELGVTTDPAAALGPGGPVGELPKDLAGVLVASHGRYEEEVLTAALRAGVPYVGLIASKRRGAAVLAAIDVSEEDRARVNTPAGFDIGARTPEEVALSVFAELIASRSSSGEPNAQAQIAEQVAASAAESEESAPSFPATIVEAVDPVCGMTVAVSSASLSLTHEGAQVYFCGPGCKQAFADDPARYQA